MDAIVLHTLGYGIDEAVVLLVPPDLAYEKMVFKIKPAMMARKKTIPNTGPPRAVEDDPPTLSATATATKSARVTKKTPWCCG